MWKICNPSSPFVFLFHPKLVLYYKTYMNWKEVRPKVSNSFGAVGHVCALTFYAGHVCALTFYAGQICALASYTGQICALASYTGQTIFQIIHDQYFNLLFIAVFLNLFLPAAHFGTFSKFTAFLDQIS